jgi:hypothetical protein
LLGRQDAIAANMSILARSLTNLPAKITEPPRGLAERVIWCVEALADIGISAFDVSGQMNPFASNPGSRDECPQAPGWGRGLGAGFACAARHDR